MTPTQATLQILGAVARLQDGGKFRPLNQNDRYAFLDASDTALIAFTSDVRLIEGLVHAPEAPTTILTEGNEAIAVLASDSLIEIYGVSAEGADFTYAIDLERRG